MEKEIILRKYRPDDYAVIIKLLYETIHTINASDYTEIQLEAWAPKEMYKSLNHWNERFLNDYSVLAEINGIIVGVATLKEPDYFDLLYVHKDYQHIGIATLLAEKIENHLIDNGVFIITADASITAKPFFEKRGYVVLKEQKVNCKGIFLTNFKMRKTF